MESDKKIIIIGHKNPDTDSICSAIGYAEIKNRITNTNNYVARRAGEINGETEFVLQRFGIKVPEYVDNVATQVRDMEIRHTPGVPKEMTIKEAWSIMGKSEAVTQPITEYTRKNSAISVKRYPAIIILSYYVKSQNSASNFS